MKKQRSLTSKVSRFDSVYVLMQKVGQLRHISPRIFLFLLILAAGLAGEYLLRSQGHDSEWGFLSAVTRSLICLGSSGAALSGRRPRRVVQRVTVYVCHVWVRHNRRDGTDRV
jgi:hypothetical protein